MVQPTYTPLPVRVLFAAGCLRALGAEAARLGHTCSLVISSPGRGQAAEAAMREPGAGKAVMCAAARPGFPQSAFDEAMGAIADARADGLIAIGGGTAIGLGKALAAATRLPMIAVPTTYSGSELASNWYVGKGPGRSAGKGPDALPRTVLYDPELTASLPAAITASSGMNAMAHAVESLYAPDLNPVVEVMAEEAIRLLASSLPIAVENPADLEARGGALRGAWFAAGFRARTGLEHVLAQRIRDAFGLDHAATHAVVLPYVAAFNAPAAEGALARAARALGAADAGEGLHALNRRLGLASGLAALGMPESGIDEAVARVAAAEIANPREAGPREIRRIIEAAFAGAPPGQSGLAGG